MRSFKLASGLSLLVLTTLSAPAFAQSAPGVSYPAPCSNVQPAKSDEAHAFYTVGRSSYDEGNYGAALVQFHKAYTRDCSKHDLLVIISRSYEGSGDKVEAVRALELYLERVKDSPDAATHKTKIDNLKRLIATQPPPPPKVESREHTIPPWIVVGVGGAAMITGTVLLIAAPTRPENCSSRTHDCDPQEGRSLEQDKEQASSSLQLTNAGIGFLLSGLGVAAAGLLWHFLEPTGPVTASGALQPRILPSVAPGYGGVTLGARF